MADKDISEYSPLVLALDTSDLELGVKLAAEIRDYVDIVKVGLQLFAARGAEAVETLRAEGFEVFLDIKLMDIPNTVAKACVALCELEPFMITIHTMGGQEMMRAAEAAVQKRCRDGTRRPLLIGVTVLTSIDMLALKKIGVFDSIEGQVLRLAKLARDSNLDGLVTSPLETLPVRREVGDDMLLVTPGVRLGEVGRDDQKRVATPSAAMKSGANFLVVGRPLYLAEEPAAVARAFLGDAGRL